MSYKLCSHYANIKRDRLNARTGFGADLTTSVKEVADHFAMGEPLPSLVFSLFVSQCAKPGNVSVENSIPNERDDAPLW
jgi:hypothetical protein